MQSFNFAGKNSLADFGVYMAKTPSIPSPHRKVTYTPIPGRSGSLVYDEHAYEDITLAAECGIAGNVFYRLDEIKAWLFESGESSLVFSFAGDKKYIAQVVNRIDFEIALRKIGKFVVIFNCHPFRYAVNEPKITVTAQNTALINNGTLACEPLVEVYGSGNITLKIGEQEMVLSGISGKIILNSALQDAYDDALNNLNGKVSGEYFKLPVGSNAVSWSGSVSRVEVTQNRRWL